MVTFFLILALVLIGMWAIARFVLAGPDLAAFDMPRHPPVRADVSPGNAAIVAEVAKLVREGARASGRDRLKRMRATMDALGASANLGGLRIKPADAGGVPGEWLVPEGSDGHGRLLYIHGGAFTMGSTRSHRGITSELARRTGLAVLAIDYRLMPEHPRLAGIQDSRTAYRWMLDNGPDAPGRATTVFVAGDSAGGNLTLGLIAWIRDRLRNPSADGNGGPLAAPDGAIALSPATDSTFASPSIRGNITKDPMLGPMASMLTRVPRTLLLWVTWLQNRLRPSDPRLSPVYGDLADLPPTLVQASESEILIDDARRWVNRARVAGSPAELETWHGMVHVWQAFGPHLPEADEAFDRMAAFIARVRGRDEARRAG
jgi:monoterpene epsilon-lactone hydrolase